MTSVKWMATHNKSQARILSMFGEKYINVVFVALQFCYTVFFFAVTGLLWWSWELNVAYIAAMVLFSSWNGANYYFSVFASRYVEDLLKLEKLEEPSSE
eukprot:CAMPEP_0184727160 /NCGR_PEP_ID=MMETSP0314-20130426/35768_1 /TAXON_ID=38298 /ORGANISM="Rhodella maculata, Strain CCMP 736" /LENGTH=98 /DNA_ID=CAMNT_0027192715 /DNA_START=137 /DNA_END=433 /DNA_ORIENTATION=+